ncbi:MAG: hypothetical protein IJ068_05230 [Bacilli bacterium]|nr:hypothetical protein [Bacilli bacterium]
MNNQMPYIDNLYMGGSPNFGPNYNNQQNNIYRTVERLNNRVNRLERQVKILENRVNRLASNDAQFLNSEFDDNNNMYML